MQTRSIGPLDVSVVGLGCNNFGGRLDEAGTHAVIGAAIDAGVTLFDTADIYGGARSEELVGKALGTKRDQVVLATKFGIPYEGHEGGAAAGYVARAVEDSLRRLGTDRIDLYQLHAPDSAVPITETLGALNDLVVAGKVRVIGCSNFTAAQLREAEWAAGEGARFESVQNQMSVLSREAEDDVLAVCDELSIAFLPFYPLANGLLTGKYKKGEPIPEGTRLAAFPADRAAHVLSDENFEKLEALRTLAESHGHSLLELSVAWLLSHRQVASVIAGATKPEQVQANVAAAGWQLDAEVLTAIDELAPR